MFTRVGDQLSFEGFEELDASRIPWGGLSPRALTKGHGYRIFKAQAEKSVSEGGQIEMFDPEPAPPEGRPEIYRGAPLLCGLPEEGPKGPAARRPQNYG